MRRKTDGHKDIWNEQSRHHLPAEQVIELTGSQPDKQLEKGDDAEEDLLVLGGSTPGRSAGPSSRLYMRMWVSTGQR